MGRGLKKALIIVSCVLLAGFIYWQFVKKGVINNAIAKAVSGSTDDAYFVEYESSKIDEINGNASFKNLVLQSDSLQQKLYSDDTASVPKEIFNIRMAELNISGADIPSLLQKKSVTAKKVEIIQPIIRIISTGKKGDAGLSREDSLALYDRLTGKFRKIQADEVIVKDGVLAFANGKNEPHTLIKGINIHLKNFKIDSTRNYDNLLSYFVKGLDADIQSVNMVSQKNGNQFFMEGIQFSAPGQFIKVNSIVQKDPRSGEILINLKDNVVTGISTNDFVINRKIKADSISSGGGIVSLFRNKKAGALAEDLEIDNDFFDEVEVKNIRMNNSVLNIYNRGNAGKAPIKINNFRFAINDIPQKVRDGSNLKQLISYSNWNFSGDGLNFNTDDNAYKIAVGPFAMDNAKTNLKLNKIVVQPLQSKSAFMKQQKFQTDQYDLQFNNIVLNGINAQALLNDQKILADHASLQTILKVYNDRTLPYDTSNKVGMYPHQMLYNLKVPVNVKRVRIHNSRVSYLERGRLSTLTGEVFFSDINGTISNLSNIKSDLSNNNLLTLNANANFMGLAPLRSTWKLPINTHNGSFSVTGDIGAFEAPDLNDIAKPLGMASIEKGHVKKVQFTINGDDYRSTGKLLLLYNDLKVKLLKNTGEGQPEIKKKTVTSFLANLFMQDSNPMTGQTRTAAIAYDRDTKKSFFNLLWQSIFQGAKKVTKGKNDG